MQQFHKSNQYQSQVLFTKDNLWDLKSLAAEHKSNLYFFMLHCFFQEPVFHEVKTWLAQSLQQDPNLAANVRLQDFSLQCEKWIGATMLKKEVKQIDSIYRLFYSLTMCLEEVKSLKLAWFSSPVKVRIDKAVLGDMEYLLWTWPNCSLGALQEDELQKLRNSLQSSHKSEDVLELWDRFWVHALSACYFVDVCRENGIAIESINECICSLKNILQGPLLKAWLQGAEENYKIKGLLNKKNAQEMRLCLVDHLQDLTSIFQAANAIMQDAEIKAA